MSIPGNLKKDSFQLVDQTPVLRAWGQRKVATDMDLMSMRVGFATAEFAQRNSELLRRDAPEPWASSSWTAACLLRPQADHSACFTFLSHWLADAARLVPGEEAGFIASLRKRNAPQDVVNDVLKMEVIYTARAIAAASRDPSLMPVRPFNEGDEEVRFPRPPLEGFARACFEYGYFAVPALLNPDLGSTKEGRQYLADRLHYECEGHRSRVFPNINWRAPSAADYLLRMMRWTTKEGELELALPPGYAQLMRVRRDLVSPREPENPFLGRLNDCFEQVFNEIALEEHRRHAPRAVGSVEYRRLHGSIAPRIVEVAPNCEMAPL